MITTINEFKLFLIKESYFKDNDYYINKAIELYDDNYTEEIYTMTYPDNEIEDNREHYLEFLYDMFSNEIEDILEDIYYTLENTKEIYRMITVSDEWSINNLNDKPLGIYWSYEENSAEAHWGYNNNNYKTVLLIGKIEDINIVDIEESLLLNLNPSIGKEEKEIRLKEGNKILISLVKIDNIETEVNKYYNV